MTNNIGLAYAQFLAPVPWQLFLTLTFDRTRATPSHATSPERADKGFRRLIQFVNERLFGARWLRKSKHKGVVWARVDEAHRDGALHFHAVLYSPSSSIPVSLIRAIGDWWRNRFGLARAEVPKSRKDVLHYLTKHVGDPDRAEFQLSHNFPKFEWRAR